jgi:ABC-type anion transport system duplicated permease subunit
MIPILLTFISAVILMPLLLFIGSLLFLVLMTFIAGILSIPSELFEAVRGMKNDPPP